MRREQGFTIVEVVLFIAISGLIIMAVLSGFQSSIENNRVTDTTRSLEGVIEAEYTSVRTGSVTREFDTAGKAVCVTPAISAFPGASNECLVIGKLLQIKADSTINSYNIVASVAPSDSCATPASLSGVSAIRRYCPQVLDMNSPSDTYSPEWSASISKVGFLNTSGSGYRNMNYIAFLRDPRSELVYVMPFYEASAPITSFDLRSAAKLNPNYANTRGSVCIAHDSFPVRTSHVLFSGGEGLGSIDTGTDNVDLSLGLEC